MLNRCYETDLTDAAWELVKPLLPAARHGGRPRTTDVRAVVNAIFYLLRTGCQWRLLPHQFPTLGHGLPLLAELGAFWNLGAIAPRRLGTGAYGSGTCGVSERGHHGRSIAQDHGARRPARLRRVPACEGTPAPHPGGYPGAQDGPPSRASQYVGPRCGGSSAGWCPFGEGA